MYSDDRYQSLAKHTRHYENEVPFEVPEGWEWCQVSDIFELNPKNDVPDDTQSGFIPMACVDDGFGYAHSFETRLWGEIRKGYSHFQNGDIGIAKISPCFENRKSTIFYDLPNGIGAGTTELTVLRGCCVNTEFYLYLFQSEWYIFEGTKEFKGVVGQQRVNKEIFTTLLIPLPPIEEQNRIVTKIKKWFSLIDTLETAKEDLQTSITQVKSKILNLAIHGKLVPQDPNDEPAIELLKRINPKFTPCDNGHCPLVLPQGWEVSAIGDYVETVTDFVASGSFAALRENVTYYKSPNYAVLVKIQDFQNGFTDDLTYTDKHGYEFLYKSNLYGGELIMSNVGSIGKLFIVPKLNRPMTLAPNSIMVRFHKEEHTKWFYYVFSSPFGFELLTSIASATAISKFNKTDFKKLKIPIPPLSEQKRIVTKIQELFAVLDEIQKSIEA